MKNKKIRRTVFLGMFCAASMILSYVESFFSLGIPGVKAGLPNIFTVFILYSYGVIPAFLVSLVRIILTAFLFGSVMSMWYSLAGALLSILIMFLMKKTGIFSAVGVSVAGGVSHNAAQIAVAVFVTGTEKIAVYFPILAFSGTVAGIITGLAAYGMMKKVKKQTVKNQL